MNKIFQQRWFYHSIIWLVLFSFVFYSAIGEIENDIYAPFIMGLLSLLPAAFIVYSSFGIKQKLFDKRFYLFTGLAVFVLVVLSLLLFNFLESSQYGMRNSNAGHLTNILFIILASLGFQYFKRGIIGQYQIQELRAKTAEIELNTLRAQINPHFLFNTLNNIYGINQIDSSIGSEMLLELSDVMRYHLSFSKKDKVLLKDEIELLESYISLEKLRLQDNCVVKTNFTSNNVVLVSPLLFLPFVENAFKHGTHPVNPSFVTIDLKVEGNKVIFFVENSIILDKKIIKTHIGLENTKKRLELIYPNAHSLTIDNTQEKFSVQLIINL
ncbi:histidine kinase [Saprospiraceae bacterium]|nr:histidine kinase [Saprospiraceae bacterium]